jgi:deazaflavin-dependent oxidoreductase (nitroreductase family)
MTRTPDLQPLGAAEYAYLTTRGRVSGRPHEVEIWFAVSDGEVWMISGGMERSDWVRNLLAEPQVTLRIGPVVIEAIARAVRDDAASWTARRSLAAKYQGWRQGQPLSDWAAQGLAVALTPLST